MRALTVAPIFRAQIGDNTASRPGVWNVEGRAKWSAWTAVQGLSCTEAQAQYVATMDATLVGTKWRLRATQLGCPHRCVGYYECVSRSSVMRAHKHVGKYQSNALAQAVACDVR